MNEWHTFVLKCYITVPTNVIFRFLFLPKESEPLKYIFQGGWAAVPVRRRSPLAPMGGMTVPVSLTWGGETDERTAASLVDEACTSPSSLPGFPGMTFSLGNHFLRAPTAIFILKSFSKSCLAHVNAAVVAFALTRAPSAVCAHVELPATGSEQHRGCASVHGDPVNSDSVRAQCSDHHVSFLLLAQDNS